MLLPLVLLLGGAVSTFGGFVVLAAERGRPVRLDRRQLATLAREAAAKAIVFALSPLGWAEPGPTERPGDVSRPPVLLLPGHGHNRAALTFLRAFLVQRGWPWVWTVNLPGPDATMARRAEKVAEAVALLRRRSGSDRVDIVAHSMGGLAAAWYVRHQQGDVHVRRLVTLGTPWAGTRMAVFARGHAAEELLPGAPILDELSPPAVPTIAIWSEDDPIVVPSRSALPDGAESVRIEAAGHTEMLTSARVFRAVQAALSHPLPGSAS